ncbi:glutathione S-transferase 3, mitochondrial-like [Oscarella lobularis]|uniref:glutathione S-transferase 3, mitochondrial-like n=1 Tax=Oscarella lobularis TaxID=121494 RepID=UPI0033133C34
MDLASFDKDYGYVALVGTGSALLNTYFAIRVVRARTQYGVKAPDVYSDTQPAFNCVQRVHQNTLEMYPQFLMTLFVGGLQYPRLSALGGAIYLAGRMAYSYGYNSGDPSKRSYGEFGGIGALIMLGCTASFGLKVLGII